MNKTRDMLRFPNKKKEMPKTEAELSNETKERVAEAKKYIENHYKDKMKHMKQRRER